MISLIEYSLSHCLKPIRKHLCTTTTRQTDTHTNHYHLKKRKNDCTLFANTRVVSTTFVVQLQFVVVVYWPAF
jgi:hypothetical protein